MGAGLAGLTAAHVLAAQGIAVTVVEARQRVGGRIMTVAADLPDGGPLDLGATWHWTDQPAVRTLAAELGVAAFAQPVAGATLHEKDDASPPGPVEVPPAPAAALRFVDGAGELCDRLADRLPAGAVELGREVTDLALDGDGVAVTSEAADGSSETRRSTHAIVALPPRLVLQNVSFTPGLAAEVVEAMRATPTWMGEAVKCVAVYGSAFWRAAGLSGSAFSDAGPLAEVHDASGPDGWPAALWGFVALDPDYRAMGPSERVPLVLEQLGRLFGPEGADPLQYSERDWSADAYTCEDEHHHGTPLAYGSPLLAEPQWGGRLLLAGSETADQGGGHMEGAVASGRRAARLVTTTPG